MKLLLDELYSKAIAEQLREGGHDVVAVKELPNLEVASDSELLEWSVRERRVIVTNNVADFVPLVRECEHYGLIFTSDRSLPRSRNTVGQFVSALERFLAEHSEESALRDQTQWLAP